MNTSTNITPKPKRTYDEMMDLILDKARNDERIRAVTMEGSRANEHAVHDEYSDFDICYYVDDVRKFTNDKHWIEYFGDILIVQCPDDDYNSPYDYNGHENYAYLIQFQDGNRIDLTLIDVRNIARECENTEPRTILLNKDHFKELIPINTEAAFYIKKPSEKEYYDTCNEFRWISLYVTKGLCRHELYYAKYCYDVLMLKMFMKMINWKIGIDNQFRVTTGNHGKYLKRYLSADEMDRFQSIFPNGEYDDIWNKLFVMYDYFAEIAEYVAEKLNYPFDAEESGQIQAFCSRRREALYAE